MVALIPRAIETTSITFSFNTITKIGQDTIITTAKLQRRVRPSLREARADGELVLFFPPSLLVRNDRRAPREGAHLARVFFRENF